MTVGILGLGLIGGSFARAYAKAGHKVLVAMRNQSMYEFAEMAGAVHGKLTPETIPECDLIILAIYPAGSASWLEQNGQYVASHTLVIDACGVKREVCDRCFPVAKQYGFTFVGGHPMAGTHNSGFKFSRSNMFQGAPMVLVPPRFDDMELLDQVKDALAPCGFGSFSVTTADDHDRMIAFTSQMPHIVSNAYIKSPTAKAHKGFSAGSYKDMTRVAWLNAPMWAELCMENRDHILSELETYISALEQYRDAVRDQDLPKLTALFEEGKRCKEEVDG